MFFLPKVQTISPEDSQLRPFIDFYYFLSSPVGEKNKNWQFYHYPHYKTALAIFEKSEVRIKDDIRYINSNPAIKYSVIYNCNIDHAKKEVLSGKFSVVGVVFKALGSNHFKINKIKEVGSAIESRFDELFTLESNQERAIRLDGIMHDHYEDIGIDDLEKAVALVLSTQGAINLEEVSMVTGQSRRTILRYFRRHIGCSFREFKSVVKFRRALELGVKKPFGRNLSDIAYSANYYDQSDLIKEFRSKTKATPKKILRDISSVAENLLWKPT